jgi:hypothetical protein
MKTYLTALSFAAAIYAPPAAMSAYATSGLLLRRGQRNQRQKRKDRRRAFASGNRKAFA